MAALLLCAAGAQAAGLPVIGTSQRAMSPKMTAQSYGARLQETALGNYVADGMRQASGADIAIECGGHLIQSLPGGSLTEADARAVFAGDLDVVLVDLPSELLFDLLEYMVGTAQIDEAELLDPDSGSDCFPQISGFSFAFDVSQLPGRRLRWVALDSGQQLRRDDGQILTAALPADLLDGTMGFPMSEVLEFRAVGTQSELLISHIKSQGEVIIPETGRITMVGSSERTLYETFQIGSLLPYLILVVLLFRFFRRGRAEQPRQK